MARRNRGLFADLIDIAARLPWWGGVALALLAYFILHAVAVREVAITPEAGKMGGLVAAQFGQILARIGQYLLPGAFLFGAAVSAVQQVKRKRLMAQTQARGRQGALLDMSWREFETLVGEAFRRRGFSVVETGGKSRDGGVDLVLRKGNETHLVQCKQWRAMAVGVETVRELYGVMAAKGATGGYVFTSGRFSSDARKFAEGRNIHLIDGEALSEMIGRTQAPKGAVAPSEAIAEQGTAPRCPRCGGPMVRRIAQKGSNAGKPFWGCSAYPKCTGLVRMDN